MSARSALYPRRRLLCALVLALAACRRTPPRDAEARSGRPAWDRVAFASQLVRQEYPELVEQGDFARLPALVRVVDSARAALPAGGSSPDARTTGGPARDLIDLRADLLRHAPPRTVAANCRRILLGLIGAGQVAPHPPPAPDLKRGAALYQTGCAPCHGPPAGPPPAAVAQMVPQPPSATLGMSTPYELFNRITYGGAETPMPAFADTLPAEARWDIAFWLFAVRWPPCAGQHASLRSAELALLSDRDLWDRGGWGAAACQRRTFAP